MKQTALFTSSGTAYWHFHPIGTGVIFNYNIKTKQVLVTCEFSGQLIEVKDFYQDGGFIIPQDFKSASMEIYQEMVEDGVTIVLDYLDDPEIVGCIGVDFSLMLN
jgi:hypothetical protein